MVEGNGDSQNGEARGTQQERQGICRAQTVDAIVVRIAKRMRIIGAIAVMFFLPLAGACLSTTPAEAAQAYTPHDVIQIEGDSAFTAENGVTGGQGT